jgi:hypothetical protein
MKKCGDCGGSMARFIRSLKEIYQKKRNKKMTNENAVYHHRGEDFKFNDHVYMEAVIAPEEKRSGRLVQVRKGCGQFGSDLYFVRLRDNSLMTFENVFMRHVDDEKFEEAWYVCNGREPPKIPPQQINEDDSPNVQYSMAGGLYPEIGFIIENPQQPQTPGMFTLTVVEGDEDLNENT